MSLKLITGPTSEPLSFDEAKLFLRVDSDDEIDTIGTLITAARQAYDGIDGILGRCLMTQTWALTLDAFPACGTIDIPLTPVQTITGLTYLDANGATQTLAGASYGLQADELTAAIYLKSNQNWPTTLCQRDAITVTFVAGYTALPTGIKNELLGLMAIWFDNRIQTGQIPADWVSRFRLPKAA